MPIGNLCVNADSRLGMRLTARLAKQTGEVAAPLATPAVPLHVEEAKFAKKLKLGRRTSMPKNKCTPSACVGRHVVGRFRHHIPRLQGGARRRFSGNSSQGSPAIAPKPKTSRPIATPLVALQTAEHPFQPISAYGLKPLVVEPVGTSCTPCGTP